MSASFGVFWGIGVIVCRVAGAGQFRVSFGVNLALKGREFVFMDFVKAGLIVAVVAVVATLLGAHFMPNNSKGAVPWILGTCVAGLIAYFVIPSSSAPTNTGGDGVTGPGGPTPSVTSTTNTNTTTIPSITTTTPSATPIATQVDKIDVYLEALQGRKVGPSAFAFDRNLDFGLGYGWTGTADGVEVDGESCQIRMEVTGPQTFPAQRSAKCSEEVHSGFSGALNSERITEAGDYTVTITDELTGTVGTATFTLIGG
ncbi:hypothetical protein [Mycolicibacterium gadium]|uniref:hypothetical protein n=1 Tax=Mycolicibacterium gadium TaxID=1794 RepID=UPI0013D85FAE|nr:hypothetical protein [Mycolicibacterium gadium]